MAYAYTPKAMKGGVLNSPNVQIQSNAHTLETAMNAIELPECRMEFPWTNVPSLKRIK